MTKWIAMLLLLVTVGIYWFKFSEKRYPPGVLIPEDPRIVMISSPKSWTFESHGKEYKIFQEAEYTLHARVLSVNKAYSSTAIGPVDLTVGWGRMSDQSVLDRMRIWQDNMRFWYCEPKGGQWPIPMSEVEYHAVNTHLIPANAEIEKELNSVRKGDLISMTGFLVDVTRKDGFNWGTSVSPSGFGDHSCKIVWVENLAMR